MGRTRKPRSRLRMPRILYVAEDNSGAPYVCHPELAMEINDDGLSIYEYQLVAIHEKPADPIWTRKEIK